MTATLPDHWRRALGRLDYAFQPIALMADGTAYGFEALLRGSREAGFGGIAELFDAAYAEKLLYALDIELRRAAFGKFSAWAPERAKIFYNLDNRLLSMPDYSPGNTRRIAEEAGLSPSQVVMEISELHEPDPREGFERIISAYRSQGFRIALDDFGSGYAGLKLLHRAQPDILKIDRYFVGGAEEDPRKVAFLEKIAGMAHLMGVSVVAEGVESAQELRLCADAGCDMAQGFHIGRPSVEGATMRPVYPEGASQGERRASSPAGRVLSTAALETPPLLIDADIVDALERFRKDPEATVVPVVDREGAAVGVYRECDFRQYVYSPFGIAVLEHLTAELGAAALLVKAPSAPAGTELARIVELFGASPESGGVLITERGRYAGILPAAELLALVAERELAEARDQNPLTRLPGNMRVAEFCSRRLAEPGRGVAFAYYDFDNFKPFNDRYGFRNGDRVIMLFADILRSAFGRPDSFVGHLGGDDFFASVAAGDEELAIEALLAPSARFARDVSSFYAPEDREKGWISGTDREGNERRMELITVSVGIVLLRAGARLDAEGLSLELASLKKAAKASPERWAARVRGPSAGEALAKEEPCGGMPLDPESRGPRSNGDRLRERQSTGTTALPVFTPLLIFAS